MLDQPEIRKNIENLTTTFLEPSAGEGVFLVEILKRKMKIAEKQSESAKKYEENCLIALSTLYGIEIMEDNVEMLVMNMILTFTDIYQRTVTSKFTSIKPNNHILESAKTIIKANIAQGDTLKGTTATGAPIIFSEWKLVEGRVNKVKRIECTLESIISNRKSENVHRKTIEDIDLFKGLYDDKYKNPKETNKKEYATVKWSDIYQEKLE